MWDLREQVVLGLIVETDEEVRDELRHLEVARGLELVDPVLVLLPHDRQAGVRREEHEREEHADARPHRGVEQDRVERSHDQRGDDHPSGVVERERDDVLHPFAGHAVLLVVLRHEDQRRAAHAERHQGRHRPERPFLERALKPTQARGGALVVALGRDERPRANVWIHALDVRVTVVQAVVFFPPVHQREPGEHGEREVRHRGISRGRLRGAAMAAFVPHHRRRSREHGAHGDQANRRNPPEQGDGGDADSDSREQDAELEPATQFAVLEDAGCAQLLTQTSELGDGLHCPLDTMTSVKKARVLCHELTRFEGRTFPSLGRRRSSGSATTVCL